MKERVLNAGKEPSSEIVAPLSLQFIQGKNSVSWALSSGDCPFLPEAGHQHQSWFSAADPFKHIMINWDFVCNYYLVMVCCCLLVYRQV